MVFEALKTESLDYEPEHFVEKVKFTKKDLPEATMTIAEWVNSAYLPDISADIGPVIDYIISRGYNPMDDNFCWSPAPGFIDRVIIPFKYGISLSINSIISLLNCVFKEIPINLGLL